MAIVGIGLLILATIIGSGGRGLFSKKTSLPSRPMNTYAQDRLRNILNGNKGIKSPVSAGTTSQNFNPKDLRRIQQSIRRTEAKVIDQVKSNLYEKKEIAFGKLLVDAAQERVGVKDDKVALKESALDLIQRENLNVLKGEEIQLEGRRQEMVQMHHHIENEYARLEVERARIKLIQDVNQFELEVKLNEIKVLMANLTIAEKSFDLQKREASAELLEQHLENYRNYIKYDYKLKMRTYAIMEREKNISFNEKKLELNKLYHAATTVLDKLEWTSHSDSQNGLFWKREEYLRKMNYYHRAWQDFM